MHKIYLQTCLLFLTCGLCAQSSPFELAEQMGKSIERNDETNKLELSLTEDVFKMLVASDDSLRLLENIEEKDLRSRYQGNPFLSFALSANVRLIQSKRSPVGVMSLRDGDNSLPARPQSGIMGLNVTSFADGLAKFLVARAKREISEAFLNRLRDEFDKKPQLVTLFPSSRRVLDILGTQLFNWTAFSSMLQAAAQEDFRTMPGHLRQAIDDGNWIKDPKAQFWTGEALDVSQALINGDPLPNLIAALADGRFAEYEEMDRPMKLLFAFSESFRLSGDEVASGDWVSFARARPLLEEASPKSYYLFLGLMYQRFEAVPITKTKTMGALLKENKSNMIAFRGMLRRLLQLTDRFQKQAAPQGLMRRGGQGDRGGAGDASPEVVSTAVEIFEMGAALDSQIVSPAVVSIPAKPKGTAEKIFRSIRAGSELELYIRKGSYASAVLALIEMVSLWTPENPIEKDLFRYGTFFADISRASSSDEVAAIIESFALPVGSASIKKQTAFSVGLNSYVGGYFGQEFVPGGGRRAQALGLNSPVGISLNWGIGLGKGPKGKPVRASASALISVIDIGAITAYRFRDSTTQELPEIKLGDILSPGIFGVLGLPGIPVSIGGGWQYAPLLREVGQTAGASNLLRWSVFIGVDIPIFHFYNKTRKVD